MRRRKEKARQAGRGEKKVVQAGPFSSWSTMRAAAGAAAAAQQTAMVCQRISMGSTARRGGSPRGQTTKATGIMALMQAPSPARPTVAAESSDGDDTVGTHWTDLVRPDVFGLSACVPFACVPQLSFMQHCTLCTSISCRRPCPSSLASRGPSAALQGAGPAEILIVWPCPAGDGCVSWPGGALQAFQCVFYC